MSNAGSKKKQLGHHSIQCSPRWDRNPVPLVTVSGAGSDLGLCTGPWLASSSDPGAFVSPRVCWSPSWARSPGQAESPISSISGPLDFEAYSTAALQEGKYVWAWLPRLDAGEAGGVSEWEGGTPRAQLHPLSLFSAMKRLRGAKAFRLPGLTRREREPPAAV